MKFQEFNKIPRLSREMIITEKIDGTNAQIYIEHVPTRAAEEGLSYDEVRYGDTEILFNSDEWTIRAGSRSRWITPGKGTDNMGFAGWVLEHAEELTKLGEGTHYGEWWGQGIQRGYGLKEKKFSLFNVSRWSDPAVRPACCDIVPTLYTGIFSTNMIDIVIGYLAQHGSMAAPGFMKPEGIVIFHTASGYMFKKTIENDESPKSLVKEE
jgi:hypothetical protein